MGSWYSIVNPGKRQYLNIERFGENFKWKGVITGWEGRSLHAIALAWLVCQPEQGNSILSGDEIGGMWFGDPVYLASDSSPPNLNGIETATADDPDRNLYALAWQEYDDISIRVMAAICDKDEKIAETLFDIAAGDKVSGSLLETLEKAAAEYPGSSIREVWERRFGNPPSVMSAGP